jgi:signal transduction histidine kinase/DNA-binding response OmpR family regulator
MSSVLRSARSTGVIAGITLAVLIAAGLMLAFSQAKSAARQQRLVVANYETMALMREMVIAVQDAEVGLRGYLLTGDATSLEPYERARLRIESSMRQLEAAVSDDPDTTRQFQEFRNITAQKFDQLNATVGTYQTQGREAALSLDRTGAGRALLGQVRLLGDSLVEGQRLLLARRLTALRSEQEQAEVAGLLVMGGAFLCLIAGIYIVLQGAGRLERSQHALAGRSRLLQATLESLRDPIFVIDGERAVVAWNEAFAKLAQWEPGKQKPPTLDQLLSERSPATRALLLPLQLDKMPSTGPAIVRVAHDGRDYEIYRGEMSGGGAVIRSVDITEKLHDEAALRQGQKMEATGQLTGGMAHDFNNILQVIRANLDLLKEEAGDNTAMLSRVQSATAAADRGARLTQQLLAFARRQPLTPQPTNVAKLVGDLADLMRHSLGERIAIEFKMAEDPWNARIDAGQLENAILNLAINARDAMPDGGTVRVEVSNATLDRRYAALHPDVTPGPYVLIDVSDTGTGMPPEVAAQAFDPFFTTKGDGKGTGLGLSMVYGFVRQSNGHIRIDSAIGQGTSIKVYLPRTEDPVIEELPHPDSAVSGSERILVVEDSEDVRRAVVEMLKGWGYRVEAAEDPDIAAAMLEKDAAFDLLFTDIVMPGSITAVELAQRAQRLQPAIAVLLTSGFARGLIPDHTRSGYPMIAKPYSSDALSAKLRSVLANRRHVPAPPPAPEASSEEAARQAPSEGRARRVLLVEDEVLLRMSTTDMLERLGCSVSAVGSGEAALEMLGQGDAHDLLITDVGLPGMSGEELALKVRERFPSLPVVIASGYGRPGLQGEGMQFVSKPYSSIDLQQALDHSIR